MHTSIHANPEHSALATRLASFGPVSARAQERMAEIETCTSSYEAGRDILTEGDVDRAAYAVVSGWGCLYKILDDGRRQIFSFVLPGDFVNTQTTPTGETAWSFSALTEMEVARIEPAQLNAFRAEHPRAAAAMEVMSGMAFDMLADRLMSVGRRTAFERLSHMLVELYARLRAIGAITADGFDLPVNQDAIGDSMGLSTVHVSRTLKKLRQRGLATIARNQVEITNFEGLLEAAGVDHDYVERLCPVPSGADDTQAVAPTPIPVAKRRRTPARRAVSGRMPQAA